MRQARWKLHDAECQQQLEDFCDKYQFVAEEENAEGARRLIDRGIDPGEALLFAEAEATGGIVITGDKRALATYSAIASDDSRAAMQVICFEHLLMRVYELRGYHRACPNSASDCRADGCDSKKRAIEG